MFPKFRKTRNLSVFLFIGLVFKASQVQGDFVTTITSYANELPTLPTVSPASFTPVVPTARNPFIHKYEAHLANNSFFIICGSIVAFFTAVCIMAFLYQYFRDRRAVSKHLQDEEFAARYNSAPFLDKTQKSSSDNNNSSTDNIKESKLYHYYTEINWEDSDTDKESSTFEINDDDTSTIADEKELRAISRQIHKIPSSGTIPLSSSSKSLLDNFYAPIGKKFTFKQDDTHFSQLESNRRNSKFSMYISPLTELMASKDYSEMNTMSSTLDAHNITTTNLLVPTPTTPKFDLKSPVRSEFRMSRQQANRLSVLQLENKDHPVAERPPSQLLEDMFDFDASLHNDTKNNAPESSNTNNGNSSYACKDYSQENQKYNESMKNAQPSSRDTYLYAPNISAVNDEAVKRITYSEEKKRISPVILQQKRSSYQQSRQISNNFKFNPNDSNIYIQSV